MGAPTTPQGEFIRQRLAEDEACSGYMPFAGAPDPARWIADMKMPDGTKLLLSHTHGNVLGTLLPSVASHIQRHDPERVIAQAAALRVLVLQGEVLADDFDPTLAYEGRCLLGNLAAIWDYHKDHDASWVRTQTRPPEPPAV